MNNRSLKRHYSPSPFRALGNINIIITFVCFFVLSACTCTASAAALKFRSLRTHTPHLCRFAVFQCKPPCSLMTLRLSFHHRLGRVQDLTMLARDPLLSFAVLSPIASREKAGVASSLFRTDKSLSVPHSGPSSFARRGRNNIIIIQHRQQRKKGCDPGSFSRACTVDSHKKLAQGLCPGLFIQPSAHNRSPQSRWVTRRLTRS